MHGAAPTSAAAQDRRAKTRRRVLLAGKIVRGSGAFSTDCSIRNLSALGARLRLPGPVPVGETFYLIEIRNGRLYHADVRWRTEKEIGVSFRHPDPIDDPTSPQRRLLQRFWVDIAPR